MTLPTQTRQYRRSPLRLLVVPAITLPCLGYFITHAESGRYGTEAGIQLRVELGAKQATLNSLLKQRSGIEKRVQLLSDGTLERDMIDERARRTLNTANADEIVILFEPRE
ncbi:FtsB family cell division protein [Aureimonas jatrophae]|uniref:Cell division protein FtsB n=1 Tax=Aureimonas jatrophae TaxID=1166073 RepID=A0A1H0GY68_9HYPH|nr:septum formation initiator family protein [Aureimonas jatrophae]MBB3949858.1 cell division protein FtsB [Aureimonas jatrophae]SDO11724.1 Cell division protein FtsB [Aureimonas jatrophae]